jgi:predicted amidohydrolase
MNLSGSILASAETIPGPTSERLSSKAREYRMNVCGCFYERDGSHVFNAAALFNRDGELIGKYRKIHPYWPEEVDGCCPGDQLPVFSTDIGAVGLIICYDSWWAETTRLLALKGAELVLLPNAGYEPKLMPARAIDNGIYLAIASLYSPAAILNSMGELLAQTSENGLITATLDLADRPSPHPNAGGTLNASPAGRRATRNAANGRIYRELLDEIGRWENALR